MTYNDIVQALKTLRPSAEWTLNGDSLEGLIWLDTIQTQPTSDDIIAAIEAYSPPPSLQAQLTALQTQVANLTK